MFYQNKTLVNVNKPHVWVLVVKAKQQDLQRNELVMSRSQYRLTLLGHFSQTQTPIMKQMLVFHDIYWVKCYSVWLYKSPTQKQGRTGPALLLPPPSRTSIPNPIRNSPTVTSFIKSLNTHLFKTAFK